MKLKGTKQFYNILYQEKNKTRIYERRRDFLQMKVLLIHNFYQSLSPSGEDIVFRNEWELLKRNRIQVVTYTKHNDDAAVLNKIKLGLKILWSQETYRELKNILKKEKPDIAHFHNIWYLISPSAYYACKDMGVVVVQTLHNFRMLCANGLLLRSGKICKDCIGKNPWRAIIYGCYRNSRLYSLPIAFSEIFHKFICTWDNKIDAYIALTEFTKMIFVKSGLPEDKFFIKPNFLLDSFTPSFNSDNYIVYIGRLSIEKGIDILIDAFHKSMVKNNKIALKIVGDGPLRKKLESKVKEANIQNVEFLGMKTHSETLEILKKAKFVVMPSRCLEMFPIVIIEAFACGKPVIAPGLGAGEELIEHGKTGLLFELGNSDDLALKIKWLFENENECIEMGGRAREEFRMKYAAEKNFELLMDIYKRVIEKK